MKMEKLAYPVRINKYLAANNICSRREADNIIKEGKVKINNRLAVLGDKVFEEDKVEISKDYRRNKNLIYLAFNKPRGIVTHSPQKGEKDIVGTVRFPQGVFPLGRLDKDSHGLIILTNDGRVTDRLLNPGCYHEKEYVVKVDRKITPSFIRQMGGGITLDNNCKTRECVVKKIDDFSFSIILTEGKNRQIRKMCEKLGKRVLNLCRNRIMNIKLNDLGRGRYRKIEGKELDEFLENVGL